MKKQTKTTFVISISLLITFILWTIAISLIDREAIGPENSVVGFATINGFFHNLTGINMNLYTITDWFGLIPIFTCIGFGILGFIQLIKRKNPLKVDYNILVLGGFYIVVIAIYVLFENIVINYRPTLINGFLEVSYPSSTTMLVMTVMPTTIIQLNSRIKNTILKNIISIVIIIFILFMVIGRLISGVHWLTDIIGGAILSAGLVTMYYSVSNLK